MARRRSTAVTLSRGARSGVSRAGVYVPPWLIWLALPLPAALFWGLASAGTAAAVIMGGFQVAGFTILVVHTFRVFARRQDRMVCVDAAVTVGLACAWVMAASAFGLFHDPHVSVWPKFWMVGEWLVKSFTLPVWGVWLAGGPLVAVAWNIRRAAITNPENEDKTDNDSPLQKALNGAKMLAIEGPNDKGQITGRLEADRGSQDSSDLQKLAAGIESAMKLREGAVRVAKDPKDRGAAAFTINPNDTLEGDVIWPGPSLPGGNIADAPIPFAVAEDREPVEIWFNGDESKNRNLVHFLVEGANGSGKSMGWRAAMTDALTRTGGAGVRVHGIDVSGKWRQTFGPMIPYLSSLAIDAKAAKKLIGLLTKYVVEKQLRMGAAGFTQWSPDCGEPFEFLWLEEGSEIAAESDELTRAAERWRSAGFVIIIVIQRASWDNLDTTTRSQLGGATAFGVNSGGQSTNCYSLPDTAKDQGADPSRWGSRYPGRCYVIHSTTPEDREAVAAKAYRTTNEQLAAALEQHCTPVRTPDGVPLAGADAEVMDDDRRLVIDAIHEAGDLLDRAKQADEAAAGNDDDDDYDDEEDGELEPMPADPDPGLKVDGSQPIPPPDDDENIPMSVPGVGGPKISKEEFRALIQKHLETILVLEGRRRTRAVDVHRMRPETGYSREEVRKELVRLCHGPHTGADEFRLRRDDTWQAGVYEVYSAAVAHAV